MKLSLENTGMKVYLNFSFKLFDDNNNNSYSKLNFAFFKFSTKIRFLMTKAFFFFSNLSFDK